MSRFKKFINRCIFRLCGVYATAKVDPFNLDSKGSSDNAERVYDELKAHKNSIPIKAVRDLIELRMYQIFRESRVTDDAKRIVELHGLNRAYEDIWVCLRDGCSFRDIIDDQIRLDDRIRMQEEEQERVLNGTATTPWGRAS